MTEKTEKQQIDAQINDKYVKSMISMSISTKLINLPWLMFESHVKSVEALDNIIIDNWYVHPTMLNVKSLLILSR